MRLGKFLILCAVFMLCAWSVSAQATVVSDSDIGLQNSRDRTVVHCYDSESASAEECAQYFEAKGYVRFRDIPYKTAGYDFLKVDTYPTRRWRNSEVTPRW